MNKNICNCGAELNEIELRYYGDRCEDCVIDMHNRIQDWRAGGEDEGLDVIYDSDINKKFDS